MPTDTTPCSEHRQEIARLAQRLTVLETVIGSTASDGLRGLLAQISEQLAELNTAVQELQLAQARATGAIDGATWVGRGLWAILGAAITAGVLTLLRAP